MQRLALLLYEASFIIILLAHKKCPPITDHKIHALCSYREKVFPCRTYVEPGTIAEIKCSFMYKKSQNSSNNEDYLYCQEDGDWHKLPYECEQICGTKATKIPLSVNSQITEVHKVPWQVAIYLKSLDGKFQHICGGTLVKSKTVISAAHCFWNFSTSSLTDKSNYIIAAGKYYRDYYANNEPDEVQKSTIFLLNIPPQFSGADYDFVSDIAVLTLDRHILFQNHIRPACLPWSINNHNFTLNNASGIVAGWGVTNTATYSPELRSVELISITGENCKIKIRKTEKVTNDKFCVETTEGENVCKGDSGGGFLISKNIDSIPHNYLLGVVSNGIAYQNSSKIICNTNFITTFTNVQLYENLVRETGKCFVPKKGVLGLKNSKTNMKLKPGTYVEILTNVTYVCPPLFLLDGHHTTNFCNRDWVNPHPECSKMCSPLINEKNSHIVEPVCYLKGKKISCNEHVEPGTTANVSCAFMYRRKNVNENINCKSGGNWEEPIVCEQICGTNNLIQQVSTQSKITEVNEVPWHVGIYLKKSDGQYDYICGGTLIHSKVIVTATSCFWNPEKSELNEESNYIVAVGKFYHDYYANNETEEIQKSNISDINISHKFLGATYNYAFDIAVVLLTNHIVFKNHIRPACLWTKQNITTNYTGVVAAWSATNTEMYGSKLHSIDLLSIDRENCKPKISEDDKTSIEKFCAITNISNEFCSIDNGSGFLVAEDIDGVTSYHLWGVASNKIQIKKDGIIECNSNSTITFNNIRQHTKNMEIMIWIASGDSM